MDATEYLAREKRIAELMPALAELVKLARGEGKATTIAVTRLQRVCPAGDLAAIVEAYERLVYLGADTRLDANRYNG
jgi:hypothetical protein